MEEGIQFASRHGPYLISANYGTGRKSDCPGERGVKGGDNDWDEGKLEHVCSNRRSRCKALMPLGRVLFILPSLVSVRESRAQTTLVMEPDKREGTCIWVT